MHLEMIIHLQLLQLARYLDLVVFMRDYQLYNRLYTVTHRSAAGSFRTLASTRAELGELRVVLGLLGFGGILGCWVPTIRRVQWFNNILRANSAIEDFLMISLANGEAGTG